MNELINMAADIASNYLKEQVLSVDPIVGKGAVNTLFVVQTAGSKVIVRMNKDRRALQEYEKELWCIERATEQEVPSPSVLKMGLHEEVAYMIQTFIAGDHGEDSPIDKKYIWTKLGEYTKLIHSIQTNGYGENLADPAHGTFQAPLHDNFDGTWLGFVQYNIESLTEDDQLIELGVLSISESEQAKRLFENLYEHPFRFGLNHGDISLKNTIVDQNGLVSLLDWGSAEVSVIPHGDFIQLLHNQIQMNRPKPADFQAFLNGYGMMKLDFESMEPELNILMLLRAFDKLRWAIDCSPQNIPDFVDYAKKVKERVLV